LLIDEYSLVLPDGNSTEEGSEITLCITASGMQPTRMYPLVSFAGSNHTGRLFMSRHEFLPSMTFDHFSMDFAIMKFICILISSSELVCLYFHPLFMALFYKVSYVIH